MSKISDFYGPGDIKYYRNLHKQRQIQQGTPYVSYEQFRRRLKNGRLLKEAIYTPQDSTKIKKTYPSGRDGIRKATLIANDIRIKGERLDHVFREADVKEDTSMAYEELFPKPTLRNRFLNLFKPKH